MDSALELEAAVEDRDSEEPTLEVAGQHRARHRESRVVRPRERVRPRPPERGEPGVERPGGDAHPDVGVVRELGGAALRALGEVALLVGL